MSTTTLALILFSALLLQVGVAAVLAFYRRRRDALASSESVRASDAPSIPAAPPTAGTARRDTGWAGYKEFVVQRRVIEDGNRSVCSFYLVPADASPLPPFRPGQYLTFRLSIDDPATHESKSVVRCYSLSDRPRPDHYRVTVKRVAPPADQPAAAPGLSSSYFHDQVQEGSRLLVKAPGGHFHLTEAPLPIVLVGGGIGLTPMLSMLNALLESGDPREVWLYYGVRNGAEHIMKEPLQALAAAHPNFHLHVCYSNPDAGDEAGVDYHHAGRVDVALLRATLKLARYQFYVCGPKPMMESLVPALKAWGVDAGDIHYESFGPASLAKPAKPEHPEKAGSERPVTVTFARSGQTLAWDAGSESLLEFAENHGIEVESGCRAGSCGCCQTRLEAGDVHYTQAPDADIEAGHCLLCISTPTSDISLAA